MQSYLKKLALVSVLSMAMIGFGAPLITEEADARQLTSKRVIKKLLTSGKWVWKSGADKETFRFTGKIGGKPKFVLITKDAGGSTRTTGTWRINRRSWVIGSRGGSVFRSGPVYKQSKKVYTIFGRDRRVIAD